MGRKIDNISNQYYTKGNYNINFDSNNLKSGVYFVKLKTFDYNQTLNIVKY